MRVSGVSIAEFAFEVLGKAENSLNQAELESVVGSAFQQLGANVFVGVEAHRAGPAPRVDVCFGQSAPAWETHYQINGYAQHDPVVRRMLNSTEPLYWSELESAQTRLAWPEARVLSEARSFGLEEGFMSPLHHPGGGVSAILLMGSGLDPKNPDQRRAVHMLCGGFSASARRLRSRKPLSQPPLSPLTAREAETLVWVLAGLSDKAIGRKLGLSQHTVAGYVRSAHRKLGGDGRIQVARRAEAAGWLPFYPVQHSAAA